MNPQNIIFLLLCLQQAAISFNVGAIAAVIPTIASDLATPAVITGKIIAYYMIPYGVSALFYAPLAKNISPRILMGVTMFLFALTNIACALVENIHHFFLFRVIMGIVSAGVVPLGLILIGKIFEKEIRGRMVGFFFSCSFMASIAGITLSGFANWRWLFFIPAAMAVINSVLILLFTDFFLSNIQLRNSLKKDSCLKEKVVLPSSMKIAKEKASKTPLWGRLKGQVDYLSIFREPQTRNIFIFITLISTLYHGVDRWLGVYMDQVYHLKQLTISLLFGLMACSSAVGQNVGGWISDKRGRLISCRVGILILSAGTMILSIKFNVAVLAVLLIFLSVGWTVGHNGASTVLTDFPDERRAEIASLNSALRFTGGGIGFTISGLFVEKSFSLTFLAIGFLILILSLFVKKVIPETLRT